MNGVPMKFDYSKTINEQLPTFDYYKDRYCSYELELINDRKEIERLNNIPNELEKWLVEWREMLDCPDFYEEGIIDCINDTLTKLQELKGSDKE